MDTRQTRRTFAGSGAALLWCLHMESPAQAASRDYLVYIGTYTRDLSKGIYAFRFHTADGKMTPLGLVAEVKNPSFLAVHPTNNFLYAVGELDENKGQPGGAVTAFSIDRSSGKLTLLNQVSSRGAGPCHLNVDHTGKALVAVNYGGGSVASFPVGADGRLAEAATFIQHTGSSAHPERQKGPHAHSVNLSPDNGFAVVADLGLDELLVYKLDPAKATLAANDPPFFKGKAGAGPRHFVFHPDKRHGYVINELGSTITALAWDARKGTFEELQTISTLPTDFSGTSTTAEIRVHPSGKFLYGSNRGHDSIAVFSIDSSSGHLTFVEHVPSQGKTPRNFEIDPAGNFLTAANQNSNNLVAFRIDKKTGRLKPDGQEFEVGAPVCIRFVPAT